MTRVTTPSRLHFGLFRLPSEQDGNLAVPARHYGGAGLMIDQPGIAVSIAPAKTWSATGPLADRALAYAQAFMSHGPEKESLAFALTIERCAPEHVGLGTGTQLGLSVAKALAVALGQSEWDAATLARRIGRGQRSAIGVHGFQQGGLIVDGGKSAASALAPLVARHEFPSAWAILLIVPKQLEGVHGTQEHEALAHLAKLPAAASQTDVLCRLVLLGMLPALVERDLPTFGETLYEFNRRVGEMFKPWQGGIYAHPRTGALVDLIRKRGVRGVGQSSWGPAVFAIDSEERLKQITVYLRKQAALSEDEMLICRADNGGVCVSP